MCAEKGVRFVVALFPTKEFAFQNKVADGAKYPSYRRLIEYEKSVKDQLVAMFKTNGIEYVDPINLLQNAPHQPYRENADGHPNDLGHRLLAAAIGDHLQGPRSSLTTSR